MIKDSVVETTIRNNDNSCIEFHLTDKISKSCLVEIEIERCRIVECQKFSTC